MNRHVNAIADRLSLRAPQRESLEILDRVTEIVKPSKDADLEAALATIHSEYPILTDFERDFPSLCFALATGVGKTRLMGAFITYLHLAHGLNNFFVLAPNLVVYKKLVADCTPNTKKYVFRGISEFVVNPPIVVTGDNYEQVRDSRSGLYEEYAKEIRINVFNIAKISSEVRGGKAPRIKRLSEYLGESYFDYLAALPDLVLLMDESHHYRASAGLRAINELKPVLGLELTATPFVETSRGAVPFKNVIYDYPLAQAMKDGFVKEPAVVTRKDFSALGMSPGDLERMKLEDGIRLHESVKVDLETYARETGNVIVKPFVLVIARDTTHAGQLVDLIKSDEFFDGRYASKVIQVDSSRSGAEEEEMIERLLKVESADEPTEIVVHVNMLKEGWDVTNLYTIVPLRAANARILIEQSIGRGLRLPYGKRTGVLAVDRLNIVAHDKFQEIVDEANRPGSAIRLERLILDPDELKQGHVTVVSASDLSNQLGFTNASAMTSPAPTVAAQRPATPPLFPTPADQAVAQLAYKAIQRLAQQPKTAPSLSYATKADMQAKLVIEVKSWYVTGELELETPPDIAAIVAKTAELIVRKTIDIPRILVVPTEEVRSGFKPFTLELSAINYPAPSGDLWVQYLRTDAIELISLGKVSADEQRLEDYIVGALVDYDDVSYEDNTEVLYDLAQQVVRHVLAYLPEDDARKVLRFYHRPIAKLVHIQMQNHQWQDEVEYEVVVTRGFTDLKPSAYTAGASDKPLDLHHSPADKSNMAKYLFTGFQRCLYNEQKFASDAERKMAIILDRESEKWFKPAMGQFQLFYKTGADRPEYQPDFVAETADHIYMIEPKAANQMTDPDVLAKRDIAVRYCANATNHTATYSGKPWTYLLIPHDAITENRTLASLAQQYTVHPS